MLKTIARVTATLLVVAAGCLGGYELWDYYMLSPWTRDARVRADVVTIAPDVAGFVNDLRVKDNQFVHKGDILFILDQERYKLALATAEATERLTRVSLALVPLAVLAAIPFQLCRPAFEGLQRGRPGLVMAVIRYVGLTIPFGFGGMVIAERTGGAPLFGLLLGLALASALASIVFLVWMERSLAALEARQSRARAA